MNLELENFVKSFVEEITSIQKDINTIKNMDISEEAKKLPLKELEDQKNAAKDKMLNYMNML